MSPVWSAGVKMTVIMPSRGAGGSRARRTASLADHGHETDGESDFALERAIRAFFEQHKVLQNHALWRDELSAHSQLIREGFRHLRRRRIDWPRDEGAIRDLERF